MDDRGQTGFVKEPDAVRVLANADMSQEEVVRRINRFLKEAPTLSIIPKDTPTPN